MGRLALCFFLALSSAFATPAQQDPGLDSDAAGLLGDLRWRNIGPASAAGRIAAIDALNADWRQVLVASASGGVYQSSNGGLSWESIFDRYGAASIGAVAYFQPDPKVIWVGTGEAANRNSSGWGDGIYKSTDGGRSFRNMGLEDTHHIAEIAVHPTDPLVAFAASPGHLWGHSGARGLFRTTDGGESWSKLAGGLPEDALTGCTEVIMHPDDPDVLFAGMYYRLRRPWHYQSGGRAGGLYKSTDGGDTWRRLEQGLPTGETGMIDISICRSQPEVVVATVEANENPNLAYHGLSRPGPGVYRSDDGGESWRYLLRHNTRPFYHGQIEVDPRDPSRIYVVSREFKVSRDGGETWEGKWWGGGGDDHDMWISPQDSDVFYAATDQGAHRSNDGGKSLLSLFNLPIGQFYAVGVDMRDPYWVMGGLQDCGLWVLPSNSRERRGILNEHTSWVGEGDGFHSQIDPTDWRTLYMVNHVGFAARLNLETREPVYITPTPETVTNFLDWVIPYHPEPAIRYTIAPGEQWFFGRESGRPLMPPQFRYNWSSPLVLSPSNPRTLYFGGNHVFKSVDRGDHWRIISPDLTTDDAAKRNPSESGGLTRSVTGGENHCTIITIAEAPTDPAEVWAGTDDGNVQVTRDGGVHWTNVRDAIPDLPRDIWVSRVEPSAHVAGTCYVTFDNHRMDDFRPYVYRTRDHGETWEDLSAGLPMGQSCYVLVEDPVNPRLLFVGTEFAAFCSIDAGASWQRMPGLPTVAVHDLVMHPREADLIAGTHGRSIWICDDLTALQQMSPEVLASDAHLFAPRRATRWVRINLGRRQETFLFRGENPPSGALLHYWLKDDLSGGERDDLRLEVLEPGGEGRASIRLRPHAGLNRARWDLRFPVSAGELEDQRSRLRAALFDLDTRVTDARDREQLGQLIAKIAAARDADGLNEARAVLVREFNGHGTGRPIFGQILRARSAPAGDYELRLTLGDRSWTSLLHVREDPLLERD